MLSIYAYVDEITNFQKVVVFYHYYVLLKLPLWGIIERESYCE